MRDADRNLNKAGTAVKKVWNQSLAEELTKRVELPTSWISDWSKRTRQNVESHEIYMRIATRATNKKFFQLVCSHYSPESSTGQTTAIKI